MLPSPQFRVYRVLAPIAFFGAVILALILVSPGRATDGRDFAGFYDITNPTDLGNGQEQVTLAVQIFNYSGADISSATITLQDSSTPPSDIGTYTGTIAIPDQAAVTLSATFTVSQAEYALWQNGGSPSLRIDYQDLSGNPVRSPIEVNQGPVE